MELYDTFCSAVTDMVCNATRQEKAAIRRELAEHLEDHAAYLMEQGASKETAATAAVAAMGDPAEIGRTINQKYPRRWRILYPFCKTLAILCIVLAMYPFLFVGIFPQLGDIWESVQAKHYVSDDEGVLPMDAEIAVGNQVLRLYGVKYDLYFNEPELVLYFLTYDRIPWHNASENLITLLEISDGDGNPLPSNCYHYLTQTAPVYYEKIDVLIDAPPEELILNYHSRGQSFSRRVTIPIPENLPDGWEVAGE